MGRVNCDVEIKTAKRFKITKYPTLKISLNGDIIKREYRGQRSVAALVEFVRTQLKDPVKEISNVDELRRLNAKKRTIVGYFDARDSPEYDTFRRVAANLKDDCDFYAGFGETVAQLHVAGSIFHSKHIVQCSQRVKEFQFNRIVLFQVNRLLYLGLMLRFHMNAMKITKEKCNQMN